MTYQYVNKPTNSSSYRTGIGQRRMLAGAHRSWACKCWLRLILSHQHCYPLLLLSCVIHFCLWVYFNDTAMPSRKVNQIHRLVMGDGWCGVQFLSKPSLTRFWDLMSFTKSDEHYRTAAWINSQTIWNKFKKRKQPIEDLKYYIVLTSRNRCLGVTSHCA